MKGVISWDEAAKLSSQVKKDGGTVVTTNGCFDLLHRGHISYLAASRAMGDVLIVGINSDASVKKLKGPKRPLTNEADRAYILSALRFVDAVCVFNEETPVNWLETIKPTIHTKGADYKGKDIPEIKAAEKWGGRVAFIDFVDHYSTTSLLEKLKKT